MTARIKDGRRHAAELFDRLKAEPAFAGVDFDEATDAARASSAARRSRSTEFLAEQVEPIRERYAGRAAGGSELRV